MKSLLLLAWPSWLIAQAAPDGSVAPTATLLVGVGSSGVWFFLYQQERKERIRLQESAAEIARLAYPLLATVGQVLTNVDVSLSATTARAAQIAPVLQETTAGTKAMDMLADQLRAEKTRSEDLERQLRERP